MNYELIKDVLLGVVGWRNGYKPELKLDSLTDSESGLYFQSAHPLLTLENVAATMPDDFILNYDEYNPNYYYVSTMKVRYEGKVYEATWPQSFTGHLPTETQYWKQINPLTDYLREVTRDAIGQTIQQFIQQKQLRNETRTLLENRSLFDGAGRIRDFIANRHNLVGFELTAVRSMGVAIRIQAIGLQMTGATGTVRVYLFHSSQPEPLGSWDFEYNKTNGGFQWFWFDQDELTLPYFPWYNDHNTGGSFYLVYNQDELPQGMNAVQTVRDFSKEPCASCYGYRNIEQWRELTKYLQASPFQTKPTDNFTADPQLWDIAQNVYTNTNNFGMNIMLSVECDLTPFIILQRHVFAPVIQKQVAANILRQMAMNPEVRVNRNQSNVSNMDILYELDGDPRSNRPMGLGYDLREAYKALNLDTRGLDRICLSCNNGGVKYRTI